MRNKLFLEGPIQTGKSTLLRTILGPHLSACGGFASQRLVDPSGATRGFRIGPAASTPLTAPFASAFGCDGADPDAGVFKYFDAAGQVHTDQSVFEELGVSYLTETNGYPLILLDEIGGSELLCPRFRDALDALLASGIPCLGVLKLADSARPMQKAYPSTGGAPSIVERNLALRRRILEDYDGEIFYYERPQASRRQTDRGTETDLAGNPDLVRRRLEEFVAERFGSPCRRTQ